MKIRVLAAISSLTTLWARSQGTFIYDQQSSTESNPGERGAVIQSSQPVGQSFVPTLPSVGFIRLMLADQTVANGVGASVYINLLTNSISGVVIASTEPVSMPDGFGHAAGGPVDFAFSNPVALTPGVTYYFQPVVEPGGDNWIVNASNFGYPNGTAFLRGTANPLADLWFREGVLGVPEPSSVPLVLVGGSVLWMWSRKGKARPSCAQ